MPRKRRPGEGMLGDFIIDANPFMAGMEFALYEKIDQQSISAKITCRSGLGRYPSVWLDATLNTYRAPTRGAKRDKISALEDILHNPRQMARIVGSLNANQRAILSQVLTGGGFVKYQSISRKFGDETEDGYFWTNQPPTSDIGQLRLRGLLFVGRTVIGSRREKVLVVPSDLREHLAAILHPTPNADKGNLNPCRSTSWTLCYPISNRPFGEKFPFPALLRWPS